jgi:two-component system nitrate/nitrite response regulator NarL
MGKCCQRGRPLAIGQLNDWEGDFRPTVQSRAASAEWTRVDFRRKGLFSGEMTSEGLRLPSAGSTGPITVFVADDHPVFREAIGRAVKARPDFELVGLAADGPDALEAIREKRPSVSIVDQHLPLLPGTDILRAIRRAAVPTRVIILSGSYSGPLVYEAIQLGAAGFLSKAATMGTICEAVVAVARGDTVLAPEVQAGLADEMRSRSEPDRPVLSERESEILGLIASGHSVPQIAEHLIISVSTVKTHVRSLFEKLGVSDRAAAVAEGMRRGLLE